MSFGWSGPDPTPALDSSTDYELGDRYLANADITITAVRVWGDVTSTAYVGRKARIWSAAGVLLTTADLPDQLLPGWNDYAVATPVAVTAGSQIWVSYSVQDTYATRTPAGYPLASVDGLVTANDGAFNLTPATFPNDEQTNTFYGVDIVYDAGIGGNQRPVVGILVQASAALTAQANLTIDDESPGTVSYVIEWGDGASTSVNSLGPHTHTYAAAGVYAVMVTATDSGGLTDSAAAPVEVLAPQTGMVLATVMQAISDRLDTIAGLRCHASPPGHAVPPAAIVSYPEQYDYDETYGRGFDRISALPVLVVLGRPTDRSTRDQISAYVAGTGPSSVKTVLESGTYSAFDELRVTGVEFDMVGIGGTDYLAAIFTLDIVGPGSTS